MQPKIDFLRLLAENIMTYEERTSKPATNNNSIAMPDNLEDLSIKEIVGILKPAQFRSAVIALMAVIIASFYFGHEVSSWQHDNDKHSLTIQLNKLEEENAQIKKQFRSLSENKK